MSEKHTYNLEHILLLNSSFTRTWNIDFESKEFDSSVDIEVEDKRSDNTLTVVVNLTFTAGTNKEKQINAYIQMVGVFTTSESLDLDIDKFATVNAPAIIYPFIREHLSSLSVKAGINPILLAPVNFVKRSQSEKNK
ncbi:MAG: protein-export chaperone SecB [Mucilaginibacter sp.]|uniref:protein-export chaperone SecB n=1 Tax=Mucilaginibacter sp. TaxID=1882438 RepID=UPI0031AB8F41